jgi:hypothetical protein
VISERYYASSVAQGSCFCDFREPKNFGDDEVDKFSKGRSEILTKLSNIEIAALTANRYIHFNNEIVRMTSAGCWELWRKL